MLTAYIVGGIVSLALMFSYACYNRRKLKVRFFILIPTVVIAGALYIYAYLQYFRVSGGGALDFGDIIKSVLRAIFSTASMFALNDDYASITGYNGFPQELETAAFLIPFWFCHVSAIGLTVAVIISAFSRKFTATIKRIFSIHKVRYIIFGVNTKSLCFARNVLFNQNGVHIRRPLVIFIDENADETSRHTIQKLGAIFLEEDIFSGTAINPAALRKSGFYRYETYVFSFTESDVVNFSIASGIWDAAISRKISEESLKGIYIYSDSNIIIDEMEARKAILERKYSGKLEELIMKNVSSEYKRLELEDIKKISKRIEVLEGVAEKYTKIKKEAYSLLCSNNYKFNIDYFCEEELAARKLITDYPSYKRISFNPLSGLPVSSGKETPCICVVILGFGITGRYMLKHLLINSQFEGCAFYAAVFDKEMDDIEGAFQKKHSALFNKETSCDSTIDSIKIELIKSNVKSDEFYKKLDDILVNKKRIDYVISCLGDDNLDFEVISDLRTYLRKNNDIRLAMPVLAAHISGKEFQLFNNSEDLIGRINIFGDYDDLFTSGIIINEELDLFAKMFDSVTYGGNNWGDLSVHNKNSNRAAAAYIGAYLHMMGVRLVTGEEIDELKAKKNKYELLSEDQYKALYEQPDTNNETELMLNLKKTEHRRWNIFHYAAGWETMPLSELTGYEGRKNEKDKTHACLVNWDDLVKIQKHIVRVSENAGISGEALDSIKTKSKFQEIDKRIIDKIYDVISKYNEYVDDDKKKYIIRSICNE